MALQMQAFGAFTPTMFTALAQKIKNDTGVDVESNSGTVTHGSFTFQYEYDPAAQLLHIQCLKKPLFIPASVIINGLVEEVLQIKSQAVIRETETQDAKSSGTASQTSSQETGTQG